MQFPHNKHTIAKTYSTLSDFSGKNEFSEMLSTALFSVKPCLNFDPDLSSDEEN